MAREELIESIKKRSWKNPNLIEADLRGANLSRADLRGADLRGANLRGADLRGVDLRGVDLSGADLSGVDLSGVDLIGVDLSGADLSGADLSGADLSGADLSGADLSGVNLIGADLRRALRYPSDPKIFGWKVESGLLVRSTPDETIQSKDTKEQVEKQMKTDTSTSQTEIEKFQEECKDIRLYSAILPNAAEIAKNLFRLGVRLGLKALGKTGEVIKSWIVIAEDFLAAHADIAENVFKWLLGWASKNAHQLRKLPGVKDLEFLAFLENTELQRFGMFVEANTEGFALGDLAKKAMVWFQQWIFGSSTAIRIGEAFSDPKQLVRIFAEMNIEAKEALRKEIDAENEAAEAEKKANAKSPAMIEAMAV